MTERYIIGYEYQTSWNTLNLKCGDVLINKNGRVEVKFLE